MIRMKRFFLIKKTFIMIVLGDVPKTDNNEDTQAGPVAAGLELMPGWASPSHLRTDFHLGVPGNMEISGKCALGTLGGLSVHDRSWATSQVIVLGFDVSFKSSSF